jgi:choline dehydrogenase
MIQVPYIYVECIPLSDLQSFHPHQVNEQWIFTRTGAAASNHFEGGGFVRSNNEVDYPNLINFVI